MIAITTTPIEIPEILAAVADATAGGIDLFIGVTRNNSRGKEVLFLEYEAYLPMALKEMERIADEVRTKWEIKHISMVHRTGRVNIGEASVAIAVSAAHRGEAFLACRYAIDTLKKTVPIWKKEHFTDGEVWVDPNAGS